MAKHHEIICKTKMSYICGLAPPMVLEVAVIDYLSKNTTQAFHC
jgi:hypothetical protein